MITRIVVLTLCLGILYSGYAGPIDIPTIDIPYVDTLSVDTVEAETTTVESPNVDRAIAGEACFETLKERFGVDEYITTNNFSEMADKWLKLYKTYAYASDIAYKPLTKSYRIIAEVRAPESATDMAEIIAKLQVYKDLGYDSALVCIKNNDNAETLLLIIKAIKEIGMDVFLTYSGHNDEDNTLFSCDPDWFVATLKTLAPECVGFLPWRGSSLYRFTPDKTYNNIVGKILRSANPDILIIGEVYYGAQRGRDRHDYRFIYNIPKNCSAVIVKGFGYKHYNLEKVIRFVKNKIPADCAIIAHVVGELPAYDSSQINSKDFTTNLKIKQSLEIRYLKAGATATITLSGDENNFKLK